MKKALLLGTCLLMAPAAGATIIQNFTVSVTGSVTGILVAGGSSSVTGSGTAMLDDTYGLYMDTTTTAAGVTNLTIPPLPFATTQTAVSELAGTLTGLTLWPFTTYTWIVSCVDASPPPYVCNLVPISGPPPNSPANSSAGAAPITFDITPGGTTVFSDSQDVGALAGYSAGWVIINTTTTLTAVPEQGTALLSLANIVGLTLWARRRRRD